MECILFVALRFLALAGALSAVLHVSIQGIERIMKQLNSKTRKQTLEDYLYHGLGGGNYINCSC